MEWNGLKSSLKIFPFLNEQKDNFNPIFHNFEPNRVRKKSFLARTQILRWLNNRFSADDEYNPLNKENLPLPLQMQLS